MGTDHLTSFALLLSSEAKGNKCDSDPLGLIITWLSLSSVACALIFIIFGVILIELSFRRRAKNAKSFFRRLETMQASAIQTPQL